MQGQRVSVVGAGLVGAVLAMHLAHAGYPVEVYERRMDPRTSRGSTTRPSINLTLSQRGLRCLDRIGVGARVRRQAIPVYGRLIHDRDGSLTFQPYGNNNEALYAIARSDLNTILLDAAEQRFDVPIFFDQKCCGVDVAEMTLHLGNGTTGQQSQVRAATILGADGAFSMVRAALQKTAGFNYSQQYLDYGYQEISVPAVASSGWSTQRHALHIWPRGGYMLIGFPNLDGSFTLSLHMPFAGEVSFSAIRGAADVEQLFRESFPDVLSLAPRLAHDYAAYAPNSMVTIRCCPWTFRGRVALIGDAAHAIVPYYGQGANLGFEDCAVLTECLEQAAGDWPQALRQYEQRQRPNADAIAELAAQHFAELSMLTTQPRMLIRKALERKINRMYPDRFVSLYAMIAFETRPCVEALAIEREQRALVDQIMRVAHIEERWDSPEIEQMIATLMAARSPALAAPIACSV